MTKYRVDHFDRLARRLHHGCLDSVPGPEVRIPSQPLLPGALEQLVVAPVGIHQSVQIGRHTPIIADPITSHDSVIHICRGDHVRSVRIARALLRQTEAVDQRPGEDEMRDRRALEAIIGRGVHHDEWPVDALPPGTRVRVIQDQEWGGPWRDVFLGTIDRTLPPQLVSNLVARSGEREYSVIFDEPQVDAGGDGPYRKAVIWDRYLQQL